MEPSNVGTPCEKKSGRDARGRRRVDNAVLRARSVAVSPVVSLDVVPADVPAEYAPAMVSACSSALTDGSCVLADSLPESAEPEVVALVLWQGRDFLQVTVRVSRGGGLWTARALAFSERDSIAERWTTVGLTVATLAGEIPTRRALEKERGAARPQQQARSVPAPARASAADSPASTTSEGSAPRRPWRASVGVTTGQGWHGGRWPLGGFVSVGFQPRGTPLLAQALGSYGSARDETTSGRQLKTDWISLGLGAGATGTVAVVGLVGTALVEVAYRRAQVSYAGFGGWADELPIRLRGAVAYPAHGRFAATLGGAVRLFPWNEREPAQQVLSAPVPSLEALAGLEVRL